jgi:hypothetical protein
MRRKKLTRPVHLNGEIIGLVAEMGEPARVLHHEIEDVAVDDEIALAVDALMNGVFHHVDAAEMRAVIVAQELVVVARHVDDLGALARLAQHLLHEVVVRLRPVPARLQRPAVDDIADEIDGVGVVALRKSSNRSACEPRAPRWTSEINKVRKRRSGLSSLEESLPIPVP